MVRECTDMPMNDGTRETCGKSDCPVAKSAFSTKEDMRTSLLGRVSILTERYGFPQKSRYRNALQFRKADEVLVAS